MTRSGPSHPLDVDLADLVDGSAGAVLTAQLEAHLADCLLCRVKRERLRAAPRAVPVGRSALPEAEGFAVPTLDVPAEPAVGELWLAGAGSGERMLVLVLRTERGRTLAAPATFDVEAADDETLVLDPNHSPLPAGLAVYPSLATEVPNSALIGRVAALPGVFAVGEPGVTRGSPISGPDDPRLELRQHLADRLGSLEEVPLDREVGIDAPPLGLEHFRSSLITRLRALRGDGCAVRPLEGWDDLAGARAAGWEPVVAVDEVGIVLVVFDTPHGLVDDRDFDNARAVLTRMNATALVVLARGLGETADVYDASSLNYGIDMPSGQRTPPRPLISALPAFDAVSKFLDQHTGTRLAVAPPRGPITRVDVGELLREASVAAAATVARQGSRFKIAPKRRGYESVAGSDDALGQALGRAFIDGTVVEGLIELARRREDG